MAWLHRKVGVTGWQQREGRHWARSEDPPPACDGGKEHAVHSERKNSCPLGRKQEL